MKTGTFIKHYVTPMKADSNDPVDRVREMMLIFHKCYQIYGVMRMSLLHQLPPQGIYVNGDGVTAGLDQDTPQAHVEGFG